MLAQQINRLRQNSTLAQQINSKHKLHQIKKKKTHTHTQKLQ